MNVVHFGGSETVRSIDELRTVLSKRYGACSNEFMLSFASKIPMLAIMVREGDAVLHYFAQDADPGSQSSGRGDALDEVMFYSGSPTEPLPMPGSTVVPLETAIRAAEEFFETGSKPVTLAWLQL